MRREREILPGSIPGQWYGPALAVDTRVDLAAQIPHGAGQTYLRELLLVGDHSAYHVGELIVVRRLLGIWKS